MQQPIQFDHLDDRTMLLIVSRLIQELRGQLSAEEVDAVEDEQDARELIGAMAALFATELNQAEPVTHLPASAGPGAVARQVLGLLSLDETLKPRLQTLAERPPQSKAAADQVVDAAPLILLAVAAWLQTRLQVDYSQETLKASLEGSRADPEVVKAVVKAAVELGARR
jgi:hypothetical protein